VTAAQLEDFLAAEQNARAVTATPPAAVPARADGASRTAD